MLPRRPQAAFLFGMFDLQEGLAVDHQYDRSPNVPRPGRPNAEPPQTPVDWRVDPTTASWAWGQFRGRLVIPH